MPAPTYPFERKRHWFDAGREQAAGPAAARDAAPIAARKLVLKRIAPAEPPPVDPRTQEDAAPSPLSAVRSTLARVLYLAEPDLPEDRPFVELGLDSILGVELIKKLNATFGLEMKTSRLFDHPTAASLAAHVDGLLALGLSQGAARGASEQRQNQEGPPTGDTTLPMPPGLLFLGTPAPGADRAARRFAVSPGDNVCLREHVVQGRPVMPTDAYLEMLAVAAASTFGLSPLVVERLQLAAPLALDEGESREVLVKLDDFQGVLKLTVESRDAATASLSSDTHVKGLFTRAASETARTTRHWSVWDTADSRIPGTDVYAGAGGSRFGEFYRSIREIRIKGASAVSRLELPGVAREHERAFLLSPALLDGLLRDRADVRARPCGRP